MRVLVDVSILIAHLLPANTTVRTVTRVLEAVTDSDVELVLLAEIETELLAAIERKAYLRSRIPIDQARMFLEALRSVAIAHHPLAGPFPQIVRDPKDDYLLAYAFAEEVDFLVTYDEDLLSLVLPEGKPYIVSPTVFLEIRERLRRGPEQG
jgi:putative PIN family toxin of toxin-antitoxin system